MSPICIHFTILLTTFLITTCLAHSISKRQSDDFGDMQNFDFDSFQQDQDQDQDEDQDQDQDQFGQDLDQDGSQSFGQSYGGGFDSSQFGMDQRSGFDDGQEEDQILGESQGDQRVASPCMMKQMMAYWARKGVH